MIGQAYIVEGLALVLRLALGDDVVGVEEGVVRGAGIARMRAGCAFLAGEVGAQRLGVLHPLQQPCRRREWHHLKSKVCLSMAADTWAVTVTCDAAKILYEASSAIRAPCMNTCDGFSVM